MWRLEQVNFFTKNPNLKKIFLLRIQIENKKNWVLGGGRGGVTDFFYYESKFKTFFGGRGGGEGMGVGGRGLD